MNMKAIKTRIKFDMIGSLKDTGIISVNFPQAVYIGSGAFSNCTNLVTVNFPEAKYIGPYAFAYCTSLASASLPRYIMVKLNRHFLNIWGVEDSNPDAPFGSGSLANCKCSVVYRTHDYHYPTSPKA
jgi:hypothetical protein